MSPLQAFKACFLTTAAAGPAVVVSAVVGAAAGFVPVDAAADVFLFYLKSGAGLVCFASFAAWGMLDCLDR